MALLTTKRRMEIERPSLTRSVDAAFGFVKGPARVSGEFVQDLFLALGVITEIVGASPDIRRSIAEGIAAVAGRAFVPTREVCDRLLDLRSAAAQSGVADF
jgi:hypothetical protein